MSVELDAFLASQGVNVEKDLLQYGVKGMQWGESKLEPPKTPEEEAADQWVKDNMPYATYVDKMGVRELFTTMEANKGKSGAAQKKALADLEKKYDKLKKQERKSFKDSERLIQDGMTLEGAFAHYGVKGMKWDKNLTPEERAKKEAERQNAKINKELNADFKKLATALNNTNEAARKKALKKAGSPLFDTPVGYMAKTRAYFQGGKFFGIGKGTIRTEGANLKWTVKQGKVNKWIESSFKKVTGNK